MKVLKKRMSDARIQAPMEFFATLSYQKKSLIKQCEFGGFKSGDLDREVNF